MTAGRCAGCELTDPSCQAVKEHILTCKAWAERYAADPAAVLDPEAEYDRWAAQERGTEKASRVEAAIAGVDAERAAMAARYAKPPDILEEL